MPPKFRFLADENIRIEVIRALSVAHDVITVPKGIKNGAVVQLAKSECRILITRDRDFSEGNRYNPFGTPGFVWLKVHPPTVSALLQAMDMLMGRLTPEKIANKLITLEVDKFVITPA